MHDAEKSRDTRLYDEGWTEWLDMKTFGPASRWLRFLIRRTVVRIDRRKIQRILDFGCGEGGTAVFWADHFYPAAVTAMDISQTAVAAARQRHRRPNLDFVHDPSNRTLNSAFDLISCLEVLEHVTDWQGLLAAMADAAKTYLLLSFPVGRMRRFETSMGHRRNFQHGEIEDFLKMRGFDGLDVRYAGFPFYSPLYRDLCNWLRVPERAFARGAYGRSQKIASALCYACFRHFSTRRRGGDQFLGLFLKR
jgi:SAM-dependent methyltransferase